MTIKRRSAPTDQKLPDEVSIDDIFAGLYFKMRVERALSEVAAGKFVSDVEARERFARWLKPTLAPNGVIFAHGGRQ